MTKNELEIISNKVLNNIFLIEIAKDVCIANDLASLEYILNIALHEQEDIYDQIERMY